MANFAGYKPIPVARWGSQVEWDDPTRLPLGIAMLVRNCQYFAESVKTRFGLKRTINGASSITGLAMLKYTGSPAAKIPLIFCTDGSFVYESPLGSGAKVAIADAFGLLNAGTNAQMEAAYDNIYLAFSNLVEGKYKPAVFNGGTKILDPLSEKPIGITWSLTTKFRVGQVVTPTVPNGHLYRCSAVAIDQLSGAVEPVWPLTEAGVIVDNNVTWTEITPGMAINLPNPAQAGVARGVGLGTFAGSRDVYIKITFTNDVGLVGETDLTLDTAASIIATTPLTFNISAPAVGAVRALNVVTITTTAVHGYVAGQTVTIAGVADASFNGTFVIVATPTTTTFTYAQVAGGATSGNGTSTIFKANISAPAVGAVRAANVVTITTTGNHGFVVGQSVVIAGVTDATYNGTFVIVATPTVTTFTYAQFGPNSTSGNGSASAGDRVTVTSPTPPGWTQAAALLAPYKLTGYNVYEADVATGAAAPADGAYKLSNVWAIESAANSGAVRAVNVVTITTKTPHGVVAGQKVTLSGITDATFNGTFAVVATPALNTFTYAQVAGPATSGSGTATAPIPIGTNFKVDATATGVVGPAANDAWVTAVGNICAGLRWMIVLYKNRNGYISGCSDPVPVFMNAASEGRSLWVHDIPIGPANTAARVCAFTDAGDNRAGRYFFIPEDDSVAASDLNSNATGDGITMTKTVIEDNVSATATFNFVDFYLLQSEEVTEFFRKIEVPECSDIHFSKALNRMVYAGILGSPSSCYVSDPADPETVLLPGAEVVAAEKSGGRTVCWKEFREIQYILKEDSGHVVTPNGPQPSKWPVRDAWTGSGPCGPRAIWVTNSFMLWFHRTGLWKYDGQDPVKVSPELQKTLARVNWAQKQKIWLHVDENSREVSIGVPLDGAAECTHRIRLNYFMGWEDPVVFSVRQGKMIPNVNGRKWSLDPLTTNLMITAERDLAVSVNPVIDKVQNLYAGQDGCVRMEVPDYYSDENAAGAKIGIDSQYQTVYAPNPVLAVLEMGGATWSVNGHGDLNVSAILDKGGPAEVTSARRTCTLADNEQQFDAGTRIQNEFISLLFDNGAVVDAWFWLHHAEMYLRTKWPARKA